jgi:translation elongation factor EF-Tu-like GTPase
MSDDSDRIAYTALEQGTPVQSTDGQQFATVEHVLVVEEVDVFDGLVVNTAEGVRFVDADDIAEIYFSHVVTTLSPEQAAALPIPDQTSYAYDADADDDTGRSAGDRWGRMFGRGKWKREH